MNFLHLKYQELITMLLLSAYLMGNFAVPIFEGIHFLLHLGDTTPQHSFYDHEGSHSHKVLGSLSLSLIHI